MQSVDKTVISGMRWSASDWYGLLSKVIGVGCVGVTSVKSPTTINSKTLLSASLYV